MGNYGTYSPFNSNVWGVACLYLFVGLFSVLPPKEPVSHQEPCVLGGGVRSEEQQRDSISPHSADSPMSISSPQQHSSASSVSSLSGSDNVRKVTQLSSISRQLHTVTGCP